MPQDGRRSVVYRPFVTCDDPNGVVECGTIRKLKNDSKKMKHKIESRRITPKKSDTTLTFKEVKREMASRRITEELHSPSTFQLLEVHKGAQKLNKMIDSWSRQPSFDGRSRDIAKDLLKGALDLQESLIMLGKLQEASHYMARLKKKQKEKSGRGRIEELEAERMDSTQWGNCNYHMGFQKPRLSADGSSRNSTEELKKVIRDSFARQNLMQNRADEEQPCFDQRKLDSALEIPSTSSSQSSYVHSDDFAFVDSLKPAAPMKKTNGPNLIAKLMGLEEFPSKSFEATSQKQLESGKTVSQKRPVFDIDMPKARKPQFAVQKVDSERGRTLAEILEAMQSKGLLKSNSAINLETQPQCSSTFHSKKSLVDDMPPIVIMKPLPFPCLESKELLAPNCIQEGGALDSKKMNRKLKIKEEVPLKTIHCEEGTLNSSETCRKLEAEKTRVNRLREEGDKRSQEVVQKPEEKEIKSRERSSNKTKACVSANHKLQKKEATDKKADNLQKATPSRRKTVEESMKSKNLPKSQDQAEVTPRKLRKPDIGTNISKNHTSQQQIKSSNGPTKEPTQTKLHNSASLKKIQIRNERPVKEMQAANLVTENLECQAEVKRINQTCENDSVPVKTMHAAQFPLKEEIDTSGLQIEELCRKDQYSLQEDTVLNPQYERGFKPADQIVPSRMKGKSSKTITNLKALLLSNSSFLSQADEMFDLNVNHSRTLLPSSINDFGVADPHLSLDCANELLELKSHQDSQTILPLLQTCLGNSVVCISLDQLVDEICDGVEHLRSYSKLAGENLLMNNLYAMLQSDLKCKGLVTGIWDLAWGKGFSVDEVEQVVNDIEKLIFSKLIEDILIDLAL